MDTRKLATSIEAGDTLEVEGFGDSQANAFEEYKNPNC
jgi:hypothetical protein